MRSHRYPFLLHSKFFLPYREGLGAGRQVSDAVAAAFPRHGEIRIIHDTDVSLHPAMNIALHVDHDLRPGELSGKRRLSRSLTMVPLRVDLRHGMNTVRDRIGVRNLQGLVRLNTKNPRPKPVPILINRNRLEGVAKVFPSSPDFTYTKALANPPLDDTIRDSSNAFSWCASTRAGSPLMSIFFGKGLLPIKRIIPKIDLAVSGSTW